LTVYLLDQNGDCAQRIKHLVSECGLVEKVFHFTGTESLMESCCSQCPDLVLIRLGNTPFNGLAAARKVTALYRDLPVAFVSRHPQYAVQAWEAGAAGFLLEPLEQDQLTRLLIQF